MTDDGYFGEDVAKHYDASTGVEFAPLSIEETVEFLADRAGDGPVLELAIGTGRIAVPLAARGIEVHGIDLSRAMVERMRAKTGAEGIAVTIGDIAMTTVDGVFSLVYLVFNTIGNLTSQAAQVACFRNAAAHLGAGGTFVIETGVPGVRRLAPGERFVVFDLGDRHWGVDEYDVANQGLVSHHITLVDGRFERGVTPQRYVWPAELDLMAGMAGMALVERWGGWRGEPFTSESTKHVSVWQKT